MFTNNLLVSHLLAPAWFLHALCRVFRPPGSRRGGIGGKQVTSASLTRKHGLHMLQLVVTDHTARWTQPKHNRSRYYTTRRKAEEVGRPRENTEGTLACVNKLPDREKGKQVFAVYLWLFFKGTGGRLFECKSAGGSGEFGLQNIMLTKQVTVVTKVPHSRKLDG